MVGDRLDNDILPAGKLGLMTAHIVLEDNFGAPDPDISQIDPDLQVSSLWELSQNLVPSTSPACAERVSGKDDSSS